MVYLSYPGFSITKYRVKNFKIYSVFYNELENFDYNSGAFKKLINELDSEKIKEFKFSFEHIEEWIAKSLVTIKHNKNQTIFESAVNEYQ